MQKSENRWKYIVDYNIGMVMLTRSKEAFQLTPQHVVRSPIDHLQKEVKTKQINEGMSVCTGPTFFLVEAGR